MAPPVRAPVVVAIVRDRISVLSQRRRVRPKNVCGVQQVTCKLRQRKDDIPKITAKEKSWVCEACDALVFSVTKPVCRRVMQAKMSALHAFADAEELTQKEP